MEEIGGIDIAGGIIFLVILFYFFCRLVLVPIVVTIVEQIDSLLLNFKYAKYHKLNDCMIWHHDMGLHETIELKGGWPKFPVNGWGN